MIIFRNLLMAYLLSKATLELEKINFSLTNLFWEFIDGSQGVLFALIFTAISFGCLLSFSYKYIWINNEERASDL